MMRSPTVQFGLCLAPACGLWAGGCASAPPAPTLAPPTAAMLAATEVYRPGGPPRDLSGGRTGAKPTPQRRQHGPPGPDGRWTLTFSSPTKSGEWKPTREVVLERGPDGAVRMVETEEAKERTITRFSPPITLMPATLDAKERFTDRASVEVTRTTDGVVIERGTAQTLAELVGHEPGPPEVFEWRSTLTMKLSAANVRKLSTQTVRIGQGVVRDVESLRVTIGPLTVRSSDEEWTLADTATGQ